MVTPNLQVVRTSRSDATDAVFQGVPGLECDAQIAFIFDA